MDTPLTEHFGLNELTVTSNPDLQDLNRMLDGEQLKKLLALADHCEKIRTICGNLPVNIHSGYRSPTLNGATLGSSSTSQHPRCEAVDFDVIGQTVEDSFTALLDAARAGNFTFGQLIIEEADRGYGTVKWCHCSVVGTLDQSKVGQVMRMACGSDNKPSYLLIEKLTFKGVSWTHYCYGSQS